MNRKKVLVFGALAAVLVVTASIFIGKVNFVDIRSATAFAEEFFSELKQGRPDKAFDRYGPEFRAKNGSVWRQFLFDLQSAHGVVSAAILAEATIVPVSQIGCTMVQYNVSRGQFSSKEQLILCPDKSSVKIVGHKLVRIDTNQQVSAGTTVREETAFRVP
jgi:hypothetical protein